MIIFPVVWFTLFISCWQDLYANVATTMFQVIGERATKVLSALAPSTLKIKVVAPQEQNIQCGSVHLVSDCSVFERVQVVFHRHNVCGSIWLRTLDPECFAALRSCAHSLCVSLPAYGHAP